MNRNSKKIIRNGRIVDGKSHSTELVDIVVVGDTIEYVGPAGVDISEEFEIVEASAKALIPGLVNAHTHSQGNLAKALGDRWTLELLLNAGLWFNSERTLADKHLSAKIGAAEMVRRGCTACYDLSTEVPLPSLDGMANIGRAYAEVGMRAVIAPQLSDKLFYDAVPGLTEAMPQSLRRDIDKLTAAPRDAVISASKQILHNWPFERSCIDIALAPTIPLLCSDDLLEKSRNLARDYEARLHTHLAESRVWAGAGMARYGESLTAHLDRLELLSPEFTAAHAVWVTGDDLRRLADKGTSVAHNPCSNMRLGSGLADVRSMLRLGVTVGLGTDAAHCGDHLNMLEAMRSASFVSRVQEHDYLDWLSTDEALLMATEGSAKVLGFDGQIGRIAEGYKADIVFLNLHDIAFVPLADITNQIVHCADTTAIDSVMIGGEMVLEGGRFLKLDYGDLVRQAETALERLRGVQAQQRNLAAALERWVGPFCARLARDYDHHT